MYSTVKKQRYQIDELQQAVRELEEDNRSLRETLKRVIEELASAHHPAVPAPGDPAVPAPGDPAVPAPGDPAVPAPEDPTVPAPGDPTVPIP